MFTIAVGMGVENIFFRKGPIVDVFIDSQKNYSYGGPKVVNFRFFLLRTKKTTLLLKMPQGNVKFQNAKGTSTPAPFPTPMAMSFLQSTSAGNNQISSRA